MYLAQLSGCHIDPSRMSAKLQQHVARSIELIPDEDPHRASLVLECNRSDFDRRRRDFIAYVTSSMNAGERLFRRELRHIPVDRIVAQINDVGAAAPSPMNPRRRDPLPILRAQ